MKINKPRVARSIIIASLLFPLPLSAATLRTENGVVLVNKGNGFADPHDADLPPGTQVLVQPDSVALVTYSPTCTIRIGPGLWLVQETIPCVMGDEVQNAAKPGVSPLAVGALIVAGTLAAGILISQRNHAKPASP